MVVLVGVVVEDVITFDLDEVDEIDESRGRVRCESR